MKVKETKGSGEKMTRKPITAVLGLFAGAATLFAVGLYLGRRSEPRIPVLPVPKPAAPVHSEAQREKIAGVAPSNPKLAEKQYHAFVATYAKDKDPKIQEAVGKARIGIAYLQAERKDFADARSTLLEAAADYKGTGAMDPDFGGVKDEAAYQAAACLSGEGKKDEARAAFVQFLKSYPESPLAKAAYRRLVRMNGGKDLPQYDRLVQNDISAQEKKAKFEMATCGPRALAYLLPLLGKPKESYLQLAKLCGTSDKGTSLEDLRNALKHFGIESFGYQLNLDDFKRVQTPAILLNNGHFVVLTKVTPDWIEIYDPLYQDGQLQTMALPKQDEGSFLATVLTLSPVAVSAVGDDQASKPPLEGMAAAKANKEDTEKRAAQMAQQKKAAEKEWAKVKAENKAQGAKP